MTSLSFKEFFDAVDMDFEDAYEAYSYYGGMPYLINLKSDNENEIQTPFYKICLVDKSTTCAIFIFINLLHCV